VTTQGVGVDLVDVARFTLALERHPRLLERLFTEGERRDARQRPERLAARFAAKEAVLKTLGVGVGATAWRSIEVTTDEVGAPSVVLHGSANELARVAGVATWHLSMTHTPAAAVAFVVGSSPEVARAR
jgi:holo-[acyl-carrier protein] synthase